MSKVRKLEEVIGLDLPQDAGLWPNEGSLVVGIFLSKKMLLASWWCLASWVGWIQVMC